MTKLKAARLKFQLICPNRQHLISHKIPSNLIFNNRIDFFFQDPEEKFLS